MAKDTMVQRITFPFEKSPNYTTYHADGVWGGLTGNGLLTMEIFVEKLNCPESITFEFGTETRTVETKEKDYRYVREVQCGIVMDMRAVKHMRDWLDAKIATYETMTGEKV